MIVSIVARDLIAPQATIRLRPKVAGLIRELARAGTDNVPMDHLAAAIWGRSREIDLPFRCVLNTTINSARIALKPFGIGVAGLRDATVPDKRRAPFMALRLTAPVVPHE